MYMTPIELRKEILLDRIIQFNELKRLIEEQERAWSYGVDPVALIQQQIDNSERELHGYGARRD